MTRGLDPQDWEDEFYAKDTKLSREERKRARKKDRSKYKKTDREAYKRRLEREYEERGEEKPLRGKVVSIASIGISVFCEGELYTCSLRGLLKREKGQKKNLVAVGDFVLFKPLKGGEGVILSIEERRSLLFRAETLSQKKKQLIAANIDQVLITASVVNPPLRPSLIDRYIIAALKGSMRPVVLLNKIDLLEGEERERAEQQAFLEAMRLAAIPVLCLSAESGLGLAALEEEMRGRASVFSGPSGVGKSSLINAVTGLELPVGETVEKTKKGAHTTTRARLVPLVCGGWVIDTPGIKSFGIWDLSKEELQDYFPEIDRFKGQCRYPNCFHSSEPGCRVKEAVEEGMISVMRYASYLALLEELESAHLRR